MAPEILEFFVSGKSFSKYLVEYLFSKEKLFINHFLYNIISIILENLPNILTSCQIPSLFSARRDQAREQDVPKQTS
jgi:hypothetical protein